MEEVKRQLVRTTLSRDERACLKKAASIRGMTLTGYQDFILREAIKREAENAGKDRRN